jgi:hypothetical protein
MSPEKDNMTAHAVEKEFLLRIAVANEQAVETWRSVALPPTRVAGIAGYRKSRVRTRISFR